MVSTVGILIIYCVVLTYLEPEPLGTFINNFTQERANFCDIIHVHLIPIDVNSQEQKHLNLVLQHISASVWPVKI